MNLNRFDIVASNCSTCLNDCGIVTWKKLYIVKDDIVSILECYITQECKIQKLFQGIEFKSWTGLCLSALLVFYFNCKLTVSKHQIRSKLKDVKVFGALDIFFMKAMQWNMIVTYNRSIQISVSGQVGNCTYLEAKALDRMNRLECIR